jgi:hypothetical protein
MIPHRPSDGAQLFQAVSNEGETDKPLIGVMKLPAVSPFHGFGEHRPRNSNRDRPADLKIPGRLPLKTVKQRNGQRFIQQYQTPVCFTSV